jgi:hypothetical protein
MDYEKGYVYELMDQGGSTYVTEPYFKDAVDEMMRAEHSAQRQTPACRMILSMSSI